VSDSSRRRGALRSFVFGGLVGGVIAVAAPRMRRRSTQHHGLEAFEGAPCWEHDHPAGAEPDRTPAEAAEQTPESL